MTDFPFRRICVVGTTGCGKSTLAEKSPGASTSRTSNWMPCTGSRVGKNLTGKLRAAVSRASCAVMPGS